MLVGYMGFFYAKVRKATRAWVRSGLIPELPNAIRREIAVKGGSPDPEVIDDIPDERIVRRVLGPGHR
jgi:hypothetical protein